MGKGDKRTFKGKLFKGSFGNSRPKKRLSYKPLKEPNEPIPPNCICSKIKNLKSTAIGSLQPGIYDAIIELYQNDQLSISSSNVMSRAQIQNRFPAICNSMRNVFRVCQPDCRTNGVNDGANLQLIFTNPCCKNCNSNLTQNNIFELPKQQHLNCNCCDCVWTRIINHSTNSDSVPQNPNLIFFTKTGIKFWIKKVNNKTIHPYNINLANLFDIDKHNICNDINIGRGGNDNLVYDDSPAPTYRYALLNDNRIWK